MFEVGDRVTLRSATPETATVGVVLGPDPDNPRVSAYAAAQGSPYRVRWADDFEDYYSADQLAASL